MRTLFAAAAAAAIHLAGAACPAIPMAAGCSVDASCTTVSCTVDYYGNSFKTQFRFHVCDATFGFVWSFNDVGYSVTQPEGFLVKDLKVDVPPLGTSNMFAVATYSATGTKAYNFQLGLRNCVVDAGKRKCFPANAHMLIDGPVDFSSVNCGAPKHHDDHPPPAPKHHDDAPHPAPVNPHPDSTSSQPTSGTGSSNTGGGTTGGSGTGGGSTTTGHGGTTTTGGGGSTGTGGGGGSTSVYSASEHAQRVNDVKSRVNMRGLKL